MNSILDAFDFQTVQDPTSGQTVGESAAVQGSKAAIDSNVMQYLQSRGPTAMQTVVAMINPQVAALTSANLNNPAEAQKVAVGAATLGVQTAVAGATDLAAQGDVAKNILTDLAVAKTSVAQMESEQAKKINAQMLTVDSATKDQIEQNQATLNAVNAQTRQVAQEYADANKVRNDPNSSFTDLFKAGWNSDVSRWRLQSLTATQASLAQTQLQLQQTAANNFAMAEARTKYMTDPTIVEAKATINMLENVYNLNTAEMNLTAKEMEQFGLATRAIADAAKLPMEMAEKAIMLKKAGADLQLSLGSQRLQELQLLGAKQQWENLQKDEALIGQIAAATKQTPEVIRMKLKTDPEFANFGINAMLLSRGVIDPEQKANAFSQLQVVMDRPDYQQMAAGIPGFQEVMRQARAVTNISNEAFAKVANPAVDKTTDDYKNAWARLTPKQQEAVNMFQTGGPKEKLAAQQLFARESLKSVGDLVDTQTERSPFSLGNATTGVTFDQVRASPELSPSSKKLLSGPDKDAGRIFESVKIALGSAGGDVVKANALLAQSLGGDTLKSAALLFDVINVGNGKALTEQIGTFSVGAKPNYQYIGSVPSIGLTGKFTQATGVFGSRDVQGLAAATNKYLKFQKDVKDGLQTSQVPAGTAANLNRMTPEQQQISAGYGQVFQGAQ